MNEVIRVLAHIQKEIARLRDEQSAFISTGRAADYAEYRNVCGVIRGLNLADQSINDLVERMEKSDE
ncbi:MAG: hypothetical protein ACOYNN_16545 [Terrimicrobiaceae bacterium]